MMARIRELKGEVPAPGEVLSFSGFTSSLLLDAYQNSVYIRGCYKPLFEALLKVKSKDAISECRTVCGHGGWALMPVFLETRASLDRSCM